MPERELFLRVLDLSGAERAAFLDRECANNPELRRKVEALLVAHAAAGDFLNQPHPNVGQAESAGTAGYANSQSGQAEHEGAIIAGRYKLLQKIGEGGMGSVWMADQLEPVKRRVAVKLIKEGMDSQRVLARFEAERQALAMMDHPNIAKVLDAGTTGLLGRPYFVMELVKGTPINEFCDAQRLNIGDRLNVFMQVCSAVQHAHQKGIIHRDLKPTNILVESHDGKPVPKVIDFGLAKAMSGQPLTEHTLFTQLGTVAGTPLYMAPEQAAFNAIDVDTRADIYALGVILYELLTGTTPIEREQLKKHAFDEILRVIRESEPPTPSKRLSSTESKPSVAANRKSEPVKLGRFVRGELDWIVMKALAKERDRRYETANGFARDIERFLNHEPVMAGPPTMRYKLRKFVARNRVQVMAAALVLVALNVGIVLASWQALRAIRAERAAVRERDEKQVALESEKKARARTREALDEMSSRLMEEWLFRQPRLSAQQKEYLEKVAAAYHEFAEDPGQDDLAMSGIAEARLRMAGILQALGRGADAVKEGEQAEAVFRKLNNKDPSSVAYRKGIMQALQRQVAGLQWLRRHGEIEPLELQALALAEQLASEAPEDAPRTEDLCRVLINRAYHLHSAAQFPAGLAAIDRALPLMEQLVAADKSNDRKLEMLALVHNNREICLEGVGRIAEANRERAAALELFETIARRSPANHRARFNAGRMRLNTGMALNNEGNAAKAVVEYRKAEEWMQPVRDEYRGVNEYFQMLGALYVNWARALVEAKDWPAATEMAHRALEVANELGYKGAQAGPLTILAKCRTHSGQFDDPSATLIPQSNFN